MRKFAKVFLLFLFGQVILLNAQDVPDVNLRIGGTLQAMASYAETNQDTNQLGFGVKRARMRAYTSFTKRMKGFLQVELTNPKLLDFYMDYLLSKSVKVRIGRYKVAGVLAGPLTPHVKIDLVERARIGQEWGKRTVGGDGRDYAISALGNVGELNYFLSVHNGNGAKNIKATHKTGGKVLNNGVAVSGMLTYKPKSVKGLNVGGYYGIGNSIFNNYNSYSAHIYWEPKPVRIKAEYMAVIDKNSGTDITTNGYYVMGAYAINKNFELLARYENFDPNNNTNKDEEKLITVGASYFMFADKHTASKITAAYVMHNEDANIANNVFYVMFQYVF